MNKLKSILSAILPDVTKPSIMMLLFALCFSVWFVDLWKPYNQQNGEHNFHQDVMGYYSYLPAYFCNGGSMELPTPLADENPVGPLGTHVPKHTFGLAVMYAPFFGAACKIAYNQGSPINGFSEPFITCIHWAGIFYVLLGLAFLRKFLLNYFNEVVTAITLSAVFFGSMLFHYTYVQGELTHGYLFCLFAIFLYLTQKWHEKQSYSRSFWLGFIIGLITLIRPTECFIFLYFLVWNIRSKNDLKGKLFFFLRNYKHLLLIGFVAVLWWVPQLMFYKKHVGQYFYFSYMRERFFWDDPQVYNVLFSYRKGWLTYTPIVAMAFIGVFFVKKSFPVARVSFMLITTLILYILSSWWDWSYGACFGARSFCQQIAILAIPLAAFFDFAFYSGKKFVWKPFLALFTTVFVCSCICLNIGHSYQYNVSKKIHPLGTSKKIYWDVIRTYQFNDENTEQWKHDLNEPDLLKYADGSDRDQ